METNIRHLKVTLGMDVLRTKTVDGVQKDLAMFAIAYNLVQLVMLEAAKRQGVPPTRVTPLSTRASGFREFPAIACRANLRLGIPWDRGAAPSAENRRPQHRARGSICTGAGRTRCGSIICGSGSS